MPINNSISIVDLDIYYIFGDYLYETIKPEISGNIEMFKYILGKIYLESLFNIQ